MSADSKDVGHSLWGGRFSSKPSEVMRAINASIGFDKRLATEDLAGSRAHAAMLEAQGIISQADEAAIRSGLDQIEGEIAHGDFVFREDLEDIHMNIEARLTALIGPAAGRLHTARSRNDQVALDVRLWTRDACERAIRGLHQLQSALLDKAEAHAADLMPGFTHLQSAQPITFGHHLMAYVEMFGRDAGRFHDTRSRLNECPLGAAALAGTSFPIDRDTTARALGFDRATSNSMDSVSARDFVLEAMASAAICATHVSRLAEELVLWVTPQFGFVSLSDAWTTGSSIMPQKRNPDAAELVRAKVGSILGALVTVVVVMKGLPLAYGKDMQEDKIPLFQAFDALDLSLIAAAGMMRDLTFHQGKAEAAAGAGYSTATDLADWLVRVIDLPFREAHHITGAAVKRAEELGLELSELSIEDLRALEPRITSDVYDVLSPRASVASRSSYGGTAPDQVRAQIALWKDRL